MNWLTDRWVDHSSTREAPHRRAAARSANPTDSKIPHALTQVHRYPVTIKLVRSNYCARIDLYFLVFAYFLIFLLLRLQRVGSGLAYGVYIKEGSICVVGLIFCCETNKNTFRPSICCLLAVGFMFLLMMQSGENGIDFLIIVMLKEQEKINQLLRLAGQHREYWFCSLEPRLPLSET